MFEFRDDLQDLRRRKATLVAMLTELEENDPSKFADLLRDEATFIAETEQERRDIETKEYVSDDAEEAEVERSMDLDALDSHFFAIATTCYPGGVDLLDAVIAMLEGELSRAARKRRDPVT